MKFELSTSTGNAYPGYNTMQEAEKLEALGFRFDKNSGPPFKPLNRPVINVESLDHLIELTKTFGRIVIEHRDNNVGPDHMLEIYDNYRE